MSLFVFDLSGKRGPTSSYATAGIALRVTESHKPPQATRWCHLRGRHPHNTYLPHQPPTSSQYLPTYVLPKYLPDLPTYATVIPTYLQPKHIPTPPTPYITTYPHKLPTYLLELPTYPSICPFVYLSIRPSVRPSVHHYDANDENGPYLLQRDQIKGEELG